MSKSGCLLKTIKVGFCLMVLLGGIGGIWLSLLEWRDGGSKVMFFLLAGFSLVAGYATLRVIRSKGYDPGPSLIELETAGMIVSQEFSAKRAVAIEESEYGEEGPGYLIELEDGRTLCLSGPYLYGCEENEISHENDDGTLQDLRFPSTRFLVKKQRDTEEIRDCMSLGGYLAVAHRFAFTAWEQIEAVGPLADGDIVASPTFDDLIAPMKIAPQDSRNA